MLPRGLSALRHRNFRLFWSGQLVSLIGTWMQSIAQGWLVLQLTHSNAFALGVVSAFQFLPVLVFGLFGGLIADALPKRPTLYATQGTMMVLAFILAALTYTNVVHVWHVVALATLLGFANAVDMPTRQAFVMDMVGREDVGNAIALNSAAFNAARIVGPAIAGLAIALVGTATCFLLNGISFLAVLGGLALMRDHELKSRPRADVERSPSAMVENMAEGLRYVGGTPVVLLAVVVVGLVSTVGMNFNVLVPVLASDVLHVGATGYGFLMTAMGIGSLVSALAIAFSGRPSRRVLLVGAFLMGLLQVAVGLVRFFPLALVAMFGVGAAAIAMTATANTLIQLSVPDALRGRVMSVYTTVFAGSTPIGSLMTGGLASGFGTLAAFIFEGAFSMAATVGGYALYLRRQEASRAAAYRGPVEPA